MKKTKELILNSLENKFEVKKIIRDEIQDIGIIIEFMFGGRFGSCRYCLEGTERGIDWVKFQEKDEEDVYGEIHTFMELGEIEWETIIKYKGKIIK